MAWTKRFNSKNNKRVAASINPTDEEYNELRGMDIHPPTFDKATVKRLRNMGATHAELVDASKQMVPLEDYEEARLNNPGNHTAATQEAIGYQNFYNDHMASNAEFVRDNPKYNQAEGITLSPNDHRGLLGKVALHHLALKNMPQFDELHPEAIPDRRRASKWMIHQCAKLDPVFHDAKESDDYDPSWVMTPDKYSKAIRQLSANHTKELVNSNTLPAYYRAKRKLNALDHLAVSQFTPYQYTPEMYED